MTLKEKKLEKQVAALNKENTELNKQLQQLIQTNLDLQKLFFEQQDKYKELFDRYLGIVRK